MKTLLIDIETAPSKSYIWGLWQEVTSYSAIERDWYILCWSAKWLGEHEIMSSGLVDFPKQYKINPENDIHVLGKLWKLLDEADIVIAHNGIQFDRKKINARFIINGINPPSPYRMIDTLQVCRREFAFTSNKLADIVKFLNIGEKVDTGGFQLWKNCLSGHLQSWQKMIKYCKKDITLLERVYLALRPYILQHPNVGMDSVRPVCPKCGNHKIQCRGFSYTNASKFQRFVCLNCGGWGRQKVNLINKDQRNTLTANA